MSADSAATATPAARPGVVDCHHHIYDSRFTADPRATLRAPDATVDDYRRLRMQLGITYSVIVQPSTYGTDNRCLVDALAQLGPAARGIAVVDSTVRRAELDRLHVAGVRGVRFNLSRPAGAPFDDIDLLARAIAPLGWHVLIHASADALLPVIDRLRRLAVPVVIDHLGRLPQPLGIGHPAFAALRRLVDEGNTWIKLSGVYHDSKSGAPDYADAAEVFCAWAQAAPERALWGTDWPHTAAVAGEKPMPDDARMLALVDDWVPDVTRRRRILVDNAMAFYGFG
ncbi:MAG: amidohydrolase family protein [Pseudomonadota bacterium]